MIVQSAKNRNHPLIFLISILLATAELKVTSPLPRHRPRSYVACPIQALQPGVVQGGSRWVVEDGAHLLLVELEEHTAAGGRNGLSLA